MNRLSELESKILELETRLSGSAVADFSCVSLENRMGGSLQAGAMTIFPLGELETQSVGSVLLEVGVKIQAVESHAVRMMLFVGDACVADNESTLVVGVNTVNLFGSVRLGVSGGEDVKLVIVNDSEVSTSYLISASGVVLGNNLVAGNTNNGRIIADVVGNNVLVVVCEGGNIWVYYNTNGEFCNSIADFTYYGAGKYAYAILEQGDADMRARIFRIGTDGKVYMSNGTLIASEIVVEASPVDAISASIVNSELVLFYIKSGKCYFKSISGENISSEKYLEASTKREYVDVSCVGKGENMVVILTTTDGRNYMFNQLDIEKFFGGKNEKLNLVIDLSFVAVEGKVGA